MTVSGADYPAHDSSRPATGNAVGIPPKTLGKRHVSDSPRNRASLVVGEPATRQQGGERMPELIGGTDDLG